jgi:UPF0271 protein
MNSIDLNCDMGEGCGSDLELMKYVSSVNIACGAHAGDAETMRLTADHAMRHGLAIGAHPGYADRENFGRVPMDLPRSEIEDLVAEQVNRLLGICGSLGAKVSHVKPHGSLYNQAAREREIAAAIASAVHRVDPSLTLFGLAGSVSLEESNKLGLRTAAEGFVDRTYSPDGSLTPRTQPDALITDTEAAVAQAVRMVREQKVRSADGSDVRVPARTLCIHGDGSHAVEFARTLNAALVREGIAIRPIND